MKHSPIVTLCLCALLTPLAQAAPPATMSWDAAFYSDGNTLWPTLEVPEITGIAWNFVTPKSTVTGTTNFPSVNAWFNTPNATMESFNDAPLSAAPFSQSTNQPVSFELVFRPIDLIDNHVLFETGGNIDGTGIVINGDTLEYRAQDANSDDQRIILNHTFAAGDEDNFHHVVATIQTGAAGSNEGVLYVNGTEVDRFSATGDVLDWAGGDNSGLGRFIGSTATGQTDFTAFSGDIASFRYYAQQVLTAADALELYNNLSLDPDSDNDDLLDSWEQLYFQDLDEIATGNPDSDGLNNLGELNAGTNPTVADSDGDMISDGDEVFGLTNPYNGNLLGALPGDPTLPGNPDSDDDGIDDFTEIDSANGFVTNPNNPDTDGDGVRDPVEITFETDPTDATDFPASTLVLTHHYTFDTDGTDSVGNIDGTLEDGATIVAGTIGNAVDIDAGTQHVLMANPGADIATAVIPGTANSHSISLWAKRDAIDVNGWMIGQGDNPITDAALHIGFRTTGQVAHAFWGDDLQTLTPAQINDTADWHHWVFTYDADINQQAIHIDGGGQGNTFTRTSTGDFTGSGTNNFWVGRRRDGQNFDGQIDDLQIYIGVLSAADVTTLFETPGITIGGTTEELEISSIVYENGMISLTWNSETDAEYSIDYSTDLSSFPLNQDDSYPSDGDDTTTHTFTNPLPDAERIYFRVTKNRP